MLFEANIYFGGKEVQGETSTKILYEADDAKAAIHDAKAWFDNRHRAIPEHFGTLHCVKIYEFIPQRLDHDGYLPPATGMFGYEWKCDWGRPYGT
jgi:hypothetical protein